MSVSNIEPRTLELFGQLLNETHDIFLVVDEDWNIHFANKRACNYFFDGNPMEGRNLLNEFPGIRKSQLVEQMNEARIAGKSSEFEAVSPFSKRWMYYRLYPLANRLAIYVTDINLRKEAQRTIQQNQERYFNFISQSTEGIWRYELEEPIDVTLPVDKQVELVYQHAYLAECNDAMAKMYGFRDAYDLMGSKLEMLLPRNEENMDYLKTFVASGYKLYDAESREVDKDGNTKYMLNNLIGIIENGHVARAWGTQRDITRIKEVEEKLTDSQAQLNLALSAGSAGTFIWNIKTNQVQWTKEEEALYGLPEGSFGGNFDNWAKTVHPEDLPGSQEALWDAINNKKELDIEFRIIRPDKTTRWILAKGKVIYDSDGQPERMIGINIDITSRRDL
ncbi:MAG TPA: PAS domain-containing protein [Chitinophagaceae bacterium]